MNPWPEALDHRGYREAREQLRATCRALGADADRVEQAFSEGWDAGHAGFAARFPLPARKLDEAAVQGCADPLGLVVDGLGHLVWEAGATLAALLVGMLRGLDAAYDGAVGDIIYGTPATARALREGDVEHFLWIWGNEEYEGWQRLAERLGGLPLPTTEFRAEVARREARRMTAEEAETSGLTGAPGEREDDPPGFDWMTLPEVLDWLEAWVEATFDVAAFLEDRAKEGTIAALARGEDIEEELLEELDPADLLLLFASLEVPRGFAAGDPDCYRRLQAIRRRLRRQRQKSLSGVSE